MSVDAYNTKVLPVIRSYGHIDNYNDENRICLNTITHSDGEQVDDPSWIGIGALVCGSKLLEQLLTK